MLVEPGMRPTIYIDASFDLAIWVGACPRSWFALAGFRAGAQCSVTPSPEPCNRLPLANSVDNLRAALSPLVSFM